MFKNIVIVILVFLLCSLLLQNKDNIDLLVGNIAETKDKVEKGTSYLKKSFDKNFSEKKISIDIPSLQIQMEPIIVKEPFVEGSTNGGIEEDTFFTEK